MDERINTEIELSGVASVLVVPRHAPDGGVRAADVAELAGHFVRRETSRASALARQHGSPPRSERPVRCYEHLGLLYGTVDRAGYRALRARRGVIVVSAPRLSPIRPLYVAAGERPPGPWTWGLEAMRIADLHSRGITGRGVLVGHLDTGADAGHAALRGVVRHFAMFDDFGDALAPAPKPFDTEFHGTHTAATIAGRAVRGRHIGVAPGARLAVAVVADGGDTVARVLGGLDWSIALGVRVLTMPLGVRDFHDGFTPIVRTLRGRNILPVFAAGNEGAGSSRSPGNYPDALSVGAMDANASVAAFSSSQLFVRERDPVVPDVVAPGAGVVSAAPGGGYQVMSGTSVAAAHVAGLAALLFSAVPSATARMVELALLRSCRVGPCMSEERAGHGMPDAPAALAALHDLAG